MHDESTLATIRQDRQEVYGHPRENHRGIAHMWVPLLQPYWPDIKLGRPVPEHVVALLLVALKLDRMRLCYHEDNYADIANYLRFAEEWQRSYDGYQSSLRESRADRIFVAGPYSAETDCDRDTNVFHAARVGLRLLKKGHLVYVPHTMTHLWHERATQEDFMRQTTDIIKHWATSLFYIGASPGADRERQYAEFLGLRVYTSLDDVPDLESPTQETPTEPENQPQTGEFSTAKT